MESANPMIALYGGTNECARTDTLLPLLYEVSTGAVSLVLQNEVDTTKITKTEIITKTSRSLPRLGS